jgi:hypothetical protein
VERGVDAPRKGGGRGGRDAQAVDEFGLRLPLCILQPGTPPPLAPPPLVAGTATSSSRSMRREGKASAQASHAPSPPSTRAPAPQRSPLPLFQSRQRTAVPHIQHGSAPTVTEDSATAGRRAARGRSAVRAHLQQAGRPWQQGRPRCGGRSSAGRAAVTEQAVL